MSNQNHTDFVPVKKLYTTLSEDDLDLNQGNIVPVGQNFICVYPEEVVQIVAPEANVNGVIIRTGLCAPATGWVNLYTGPSIPSSGPTDASNPIIFAGNGSKTTGSNSQTLMPNPLFIPAGYGLWTLSSGVGAIALTWDVL